MERTIQSETVYSGKILHVTKDKAALDNGIEVTREVVVHGGGVGIIAFNERNEIFLVKQYRYGVKKDLYEIPAGKLEQGEQPLECAKRELIEETGFEAKEFRYLGYIYPTPAYCSEVTHIFAARNLVQRVQNLDDDEFLTVTAVPFETALNMAKTGEINDAKTVAALFRI
jgi:ADP-ribose pyrophosphatase